MLVRLCRVLGVPYTITSNTFCSSNRLPTWRPETSDVAARRTSPGLRPYCLALSRFTLISSVGISLGYCTVAL